MLKKLINAINGLTAALQDRSSVHRMESKIVHIEYLVEQVFELLENEVEDSLKAIGSNPDNPV
jgi:hypothetical protein